MAMTMGTLPAWVTAANSAAIDPRTSNMFGAVDRGDGSEGLGNADGTGIYTGLPDEVFDTFGVGIDATRRINQDRLAQFLNGRQLMDASAGGRGARWLQGADGSVQGPVDEFSTAPDERFALAALLAAGAVGAGVASMGAGAAGSAAGGATAGTTATSAGSGLTAGAGGGGLAMGGGSIGGTGLTAGGSAATGLTAAPGAGLTLAAPTGTGAGLAAGTGAGTIGAGIGASLPAVGQSVISPAITNAVAGAPAAVPPPRTGGRIPNAISDLTGIPPEILRLIPPVVGAIAGGTQGESSGAAPTPAGPPVQWRTGLQGAIQPNQQRRAIPQGVDTMRMGNSFGAGRFMGGMQPRATMQSQPMRQQPQMGMQPRGMSMGPRPMQPQFGPANTPASNTTPWLNDSQAPTSWGSQPPRGMQPFQQRPGGAQLSPQQLSNMQQFMQAQPQQASPFSGTGANGIGVNIDPQYMAQFDSLFASLGRPRGG